MGQYLDPNHAAFAKAVRSQIYVDKTGMLEHLNSVLDTEQGYVCVSRPRRFGKSIAARMVAAYYSRGCDSKELFSKYEIAQKKDFKKYLNQYHVIQLDIAELKVTMPEGEDLVVFLQRCVLEELQKVYPDMVKDTLSLPLALADINEQTGEKFVIIIDEWDAVFREDTADHKVQDAYINLLRGLFKGEKSQRFMSLAYLTGILPIKRYNSESALNNFREYTMTSPKRLDRYVGFTEKEVQDLCKAWQMDFYEAKRWYDGYGFRRLKHVYCPNSVTNAMLDGEYNNYWTGTVAYESLKYYITIDQDGLKDAVIRLLAGERCKVNAGTFENDLTKINSRDDVLTILIHLGYLGYDAVKEEVYIPNEEVRRAFTGAVNGTDWTPVINSLKKSDRLLEAIWRCDEQEVASAIETAHMEFSSILKYNDENSLRCVLRLACYNAINEYTVLDEMPTGKGYADVVFLPRPSSDKPALVLELKYDQSAEGAIAQIKNRSYTEKLQAYKDNLLLVGVNYDKKGKKHTCIIERYGGGANTEVEVSR